MGLLAEQSRQDNSPLAAPWSLASRMLHPEGCVRPPNAAGSSEAAAWRKVENKGHMVRWCPVRPCLRPRHGSQNTDVWLLPAAPPKGFQARAAALHCLCSPRCVCTHVHCFLPRGLGFPGGPHGRSSLPCASLSCCPNLLTRPESERRGRGLPPAPPGESEQLRESLRAIRGPRADRSQHPTSEHRAKEEPLCFLAPGSRP